MKWIVKDEDGSKVICPAMADTDAGVSFTAAKRQLVAFLLSEAKRVVYELDCAENLTESELRKLWEIK
jgi:hypothetical protein